MTYEEHVEHVRVQIFSNSIALQAHDRAKLGLVVDAESMKDIVKNAEAIAGAWIELAFSLPKEGA